MRREKRKMLYTLLFLLLLGLGIGYAALTTDLTIDGVSEVTGSRWSIYFDNISEKSGSVVATTPATISSSLTTVTYGVTLTTLGEFYEFTVDVVNDGTIDAMIESFSSKLNGVEITTLPGNLEYSVTYFDGIPLAANQLLEAGDTDTYKIRIKYRDDLDPEDLNPDTTNLTLTFSVTYIQADENAVAVQHAESFEDDPWDIIIGAIQSGDAIPYDVGDEKEVDLGTLGVHTLRIANKTTPASCETQGFSQTACGVVLEFSDIITTHNMNSTQGNAGGWRDSAMRTYINNDIYNALPSSLKAAIIDTTVVSGHGSTDTTDFTTTDKLYLISPMEVFGYNSFSQFDSARNYSRQLDYYADLGVNESNYSGTIKEYNGSPSYWWLRTAPSNLALTFFYVHYEGSSTNTISTSVEGVSPAFRVG